MRVKRADRPRAGASAPERGDAPASHPAARTPSWGKVLASTVRVWLGRRMPSRTMRRAGAVAVAAVVVVAGAAVVLATRSADPEPASAGVDSDATARDAAAVWIAHEVRDGTRMACEQVMCDRLRATGVSGSDLVELTGDATELAGARLVIASRGVRKRFGAALAYTIAPDVLGIFGVGPSRVEVRERNTHSRAVHDKIKTREQKARQRAGLQLLDRPHLHTTSDAMHELASGEVDNRLVYTLARLARRHTISVASFSGRGPYTGIDVPERTVDIDQVDGGAAIDGNPAMRGLLKLVEAQHGRYEVSGARLIASGASGGVLRISVTAPTPSGLLRGGLPHFRPKRTAKSKTKSTTRPTTATPKPSSNSANRTRQAATPTPSGRIHR